MVQSIRGADVVFPPPPAGLFGAGSDAVGYSYWFRTGAPRGSQVVLSIGVVGTHSI